MSVQNCIPLFPEDEIPRIINEILDWKLIGEVFLKHNFLKTKKINGSDPFFKVVSQNSIDFIPKICSKMLPEILKEYNSSLDLLTKNLSEIKELLKNESKSKPIEFKNLVNTIINFNSNFDNKLKPTLGKRSISITLSDVDYLLETNHFYKYFAKNGISWEEARKAALASDYFGLQGYLATITSDGENFFISQKTKGTGWIGASDKAIPGEWRWVTGPEGGTDPIEGGAGLLFWKSTPGSVGVPYLGRYSNWNYGEPNNFGWEDYAHIFAKNCDNLRNYIANLN